MLIVLRRQKKLYVSGGSTVFAKAGIQKVIPSHLVRITQKKVTGVSTLLVIVSLFIYFRTKKQKPVIKPDDPNLIAIGGYQFDRVNSELVVEDQRVELSSKESELLLLLYNSANTTVEREVILKNIWNDEGHYVGRTLDVFISRLRKKLEIDTSVKIVNIRGIGYKLVMNAQS